MVSFESSKILGGIGAILMLIGVFPYTYGVIELVGAIMVLVGLHGLSQHYRDGRIFRNALFAIVAGIIGVIAAVGTAISAVILNLGNIKAFITELYPGWNGDWASLQNMTPDPNAISTSNFDFTTLIPFVITIFAVLAIVWIFAIIATFFIRRSLKAASEKSNVGLFGTAGLLMLIGAVLIIAFGLGIILIWIGVLLLAIAFFQAKPNSPVVDAAPPPPPQTTV